MGQLRVGLMDYTVSRVSILFPISLFGKKPWNSMDKKETRKNQLAKNHFSRGDKKLSDIIESRSPLEHIEVNPEEFFIRDVPPYIEIRNEFAIYDGLVKSKKPLLIRGAKGIGKTLSVASWVSQRPRMPFIQYDCSEGTKESNLIGRSIIDRDGTTPFKLGIIPTAIELANKCNVAVLCLEEVSSLPPAMQKLLNPLLDWRCGLYVDALDKNFHLNENARLIVFATTNPSSNGGVFELNQDLKSRFAIWNWDYPTSEQEIELVNPAYIPPDFVNGLLRLANETRLAEKKADRNFEEGCGILAQESGFD